MRDWNPKRVLRVLHRAAAYARRWGPWVAALVGSLIVLWDAVIDDATLVRQFAHGVEEAFVAQVAEARRSEQRGQPLAAAEGPSEPSAVLRLVYHRQQRTLLEWSSTLYVPSAAVAAQQLASPDDELLVEGNFAFYNVKVVRDSVVVFRLIPLKVSYPIRNSYLSEWVYLGPHAAHLVPAVSDPRYFSPLPTRQGINLKDASGQQLCAIRIPDAAPLRHDHRVAALILLGIALAAGLWHWRRWLQRNIRRSASAEMAFIASLWALRMLALGLGLPGAYVQLELFSPQLLALAWINPSLGDLLLTSLLLAYSSYRVGRLYDHPTLARRWVEAFAEPRNAWLSAQLVLSLFGMLVYIGAGMLVQLIARDSTLYVQFTNLTRIDGFALLLLLSFSFIAASVFYLAYFLCGVVTEVDETTQQDSGHQWVGTIITGSLLVLITGHVADLLIYGLLKHGILYLRRRYQGGLEFDLATSFVIIAALAASLSVLLGRADHDRQRRELQLVAQRYADPHDLITEYQFDEVARNIADDRTLWTADSAFVDSGPNALGQTLIDRLIDNHLERTFTRYTFRIFFFDGSGQRLDRSTTGPSPFSGLTTARMRQGRTLSSKLYLVPFENSITRHLYVGRFAVESPAYGRLYVQVELHPRPSTTTRLYPQLLMDQSLGRQLDLPEAITLGWYRGGALLRKDGQADLPGRLPLAPPEADADATTVALHAVLTAPEASPTVVEREGLLWYAVSMDASGTIVAQAKLPTSLDRLTSFSLTTYFFLLIYGIARLLGSGGRRDFEQLRALLWDASYVRRIQLVLAFFGFVPMLAIWGFTSELFTRMYFEEAEQELRQELRSVGQYLENDPYFLMNVGAQYVWSSSSDVMNRINALTSNDLNVYKPSGALFTTTRQYLYQNEVSAPYMNPAVFDQLMGGQTREVVVTEQIGRLSYLSGYRVLTDSEGNALGYANMPYLARQSVLNAQVNRLSGYVINLYVVLMLALLVASIFISRGLTLPLRLLKQKLDATRLGFRNERLAWQSNDEIGAIIGSYNQMLAKLEASQRELSRNERETAWREMARQVAHEIKNPLTPMRLSLQHLMRLLDEPKALPEHKRAVERLSNTLLSQVDSLSNIASTFSSFATLPTEAPDVVELNQLLTQVQALYANSEEADVQVEVPEQPITVYADRELLTRALVNLVRNGLQAVTARIESLAEGDVWVSNLRNGAFLNQLPSGRVHLRLTRHGTQALVAITDNGVGISPDHRDKIFQPNFSTKTAGMGLGLAITRRLIENMAGTIEFESEPGVGTTFYISLPVHAR